MKSHLLTVISLLSASLSLGSTESRAEVYLDANFDGEELDQPVPRRGAEFGEPYFVAGGAGGLIRATPMSSPALEIQDSTTDQIGSAFFDFLGDAYVTSDTLVITARLWFAEKPGASVHSIRIWDDNWGVNIVTLEFLDSGSVTLSDLDGEVGQYETGRLYPVAFSFNFTTKTYDLWLDGQLARDNEPSGITNRGISTIIFSTGLDEDLLGRYYIDNLRVTNSPAAVPAGTRSWGEVRGLFRR